MIPDAKLRELIALRTQNLPWHHMDSQDEVWDAEGRTLIEFCSPCSARDKHYLTEAANLAVPLAEDVLALRAEVERLRVSRDKLEDALRDAMVAVERLRAKAALADEAASFLKERRLEQMVYGDWLASYDAATKEGADGR